MDREEMMKLYETVDDGSIVKVRHLDPVLIRSYGPFGHYDIDKALQGESRGKWKILLKSSEKDQPYDDKMMRASGLTRDDLHFSSSEYQTKGVKKKRIAWVQDFFMRGGAEISNELVIKIGKDCGFDITTMTQKTMYLGLEDFDAVVLNNIWGFNKTQMGEIEKLISSKKPYVKYEHDHRELNRPEFAKKLFGNSALNIFLSPIHMENHRKSLGCRGVCLPLAIDVDLFKPMENERKLGSALVSNVRNFKLWGNLQEFIDNHPSIEFNVLSYDAEIPVKGKNVFKRDKVPYETMPEVYSAHESVVHLLDGWGAGERVVFEGALCGCKIIANEKVGHMSWKMDLTNAAELGRWLRKAPFEFWREVDKRI